MTPRNPPFEIVVRRHGAAVFRVCRAIAGSIDAEDAWQETFLAALRAYPDLEPGANLEAWLVRIAHNKAVDLIRARTRRVNLALALNNERDHHEQAAGEWYAAVADLPPRQRQAVAYHHLVGLPYEEVAAIIGGTPAAARRAGADGIASLRRRFAESRGVRDS